MHLKVQGSPRFRDLCFTNYAAYGSNPSGPTSILNLVNAWIAAGGEAAGVRAGREYVDVGTLHGYRQALQLLDRSREPKDSLTVSKDEMITR